MKNVIRIIRRKISNMIKTAILKSISEEDVHQIMKMKYNGVEQEAVHYTPYGLYSKPVRGSYAVVFSVGGKESSEVAMVWNPKKRPDELEAGETAIWNENGKCRVQVKNDGSIVLNNAKREVEITKDSVSIENLDSTPVGDIKFGGVGLLEQMKGFQGVGNLSLPVPLTPDSIGVIETMLTQSKIEVSV